MVEDRIGSEHAHSVIYKEAMKDKHQEKDIK